MIGFTARAARQLRQLRQHYEALGRDNAIRSLIAAMKVASDDIAANPQIGLVAPRPYPALVRPGRAWVKAGSYWVTYRVTDPPVIVGVFHESSDIPNRL